MATPSELASFGVSDGWGEPAKMIVPASAGVSPAGDAHQCRFARPVLAEQGVDLTGQDLEGNIG